MKRVAVLITVCLVFVLFFSVGVLADEDCSFLCKSFNFIKEKFTITGGTIAAESSSIETVEECGFFCKIKEFFVSPTITGKAVAEPENFEEADDISIKVELETVSS
ncbi:hypothetical protein ACFLZZ_03245 [Nanoarchaeota archaeon]